ncbi:unnamed protein product [Orchesella dallaii]|uniref:C2H2-type domain-containing protein n=1 Tax=Orchesella dallaii TaxID=48710 RepID=A0ABP1RMU1_9HEXA
MDQFSVSEEGMDVHTLKTNDFDSTTYSSNCNLECSSSDDDSYMKEALNINPKQFPSSSSGSVAVAVPNSSAIALGERKWSESQATDDGAIASTSFQAKVRDQFLHGFTRRQEVKSFSIKRRQNEDEEMDGLENDVKRMRIGTPSKEMQIELESADSDDQSQQPEETTSKMELTQTFQCLQWNCGEVFDDKILRNLHSISAHGYVLESDGRFRCCRSKECGKCFSSLGLFWMHVKYEHLGGLRDML